MSGNGTLAQEERVARAALSRIAEPGDAALQQAVTASGAASVLAVVRSESRSGHPLREVSDRRLAGYRARLDGWAPGDLVGRAEDRGIRLVCPGDAEWPGQLTDLGRCPAPGGRALVPPLCLWVRGDADLRLALLRSVTVVGARAASAYGEHVAVDLGAELADRGWTVVSGAAYGVDAAVHRGALAAGGLTVAVLACGPDVLYPRAHEALLARIVEQGLVVSELAPGAAVTRSRLLQRNRLVAALTRGTVVVEAAVRSGTASTAGHAAALGRVVMAVPGPVTSATSVGCHELIRSGRAVLVTGAVDVADCVGLLSQDAAPPRRGQQQPEDGLPPVELRILDALPALRAAGLARVARTAGLDLGSARAALGSLLLSGLAEESAGGYRISAQLRDRRRAHAPPSGLPR